MMTRHNATRHQLSRRSLLLGLGLGGAAALTWGIGRSWRGPRSAPSPNTDGALLPAELRTHALGTEISITALHHDPDHARRAIATAFDAIEQLEQAISLYRSDSQICQLNQSGVVKDPHPDLLALLDYAARISRASDGAFDITVQPLWNLFAEAKRRSALPGEAAILDARQRVDWRKVSVTDRQVRLGEGMAITLNGIAQGFAADRLVAILRNYGIEHALVNAGEIATIGTKEHGKPWAAGVQHPRRPDAYIALVALEGRSMSTSGDYATAFSDDLAYNHVFDPGTGRSPTLFSSVSVVAPTATQADALSTAIFVLGVEKGLQLARATPGTDAMLVLKDGQVLATKGFPQVAA